MATGSTEVLQALDKMGAEYEVIQCDPDFADTAAFCEKYGFAPSQSANAILVASKTEPKVYALCMVLANMRLDVNHAVRHELGVRRLSFADADETVTQTSMTIGGVTPFAAPESLEILVDERVMEQKSVIVGGGDRSAKIKVAPTVLAQLPNARVVKGLSLETQG